MFKTYTSFSGAAGGASTVAPIRSAGTGSGPGGWHPTVLYMVGLVLAEIIAVAFLSRHLLR